MNENNYKTFYSTGEELHEGWWLHTPQGGIGPFTTEEEALLEKAEILKALEENKVD